METATLNFISGSPSVLTTYTHKTPKAIRTAIGVFAFLAFVAPILVFITIIAEGHGFKFGLIISTCIFWAVGFYLIRMILWNSYGTEVLTLHADKINYYCDYKYFQDSKKEIAVDQLQVEIKRSGENDELGVLHIANSNEKIEMVVPVPMVDLLRVEGQIKKIYLL